MEVQCNLLLAQVDSFHHITCLYLWVLITHVFKAYEITYSKTVSSKLCVKFKSCCYLWDTFQLFNQGCTWHTLSYSTQILQKPSVPSNCSTTWR